MFTLPRGAGKSKPNNLTTQHKRIHIKRVNRLLALKQYVNTTFETNSKQNKKDASNACFDTFISGTSH